jgi:hypothetical protein
LGQVGAARPAFLEDGGLGGLDPQVVPTVIEHGIDLAIGITREAIERDHDRHAEPAEIRNVFVEVRESRANGVDVLVLERV